MGRSATLAVNTTDYHTAGEPFRIVTGGAPRLAGGTVLERRRDALERFDHIRELLVNEPRGHADMYGCFVTEPNDAGAALGVVFFHNAGYSTACGHGTIALVTWAIDTGVVPRREPETTVVVDVPSGRLEARASVDAGKVRSVRFRNVPSYVEAAGIELESTAGPLAIDVAFGGAFYASVAAAGVGLTVERRHLPAFISLGRELKEKLERRQTFVHPLEPELKDIYGVTFFEELSAQAGGVRQRNVTVFADGEVDRSPCGSGTSARLAILDAHGTLERGAVLSHEGILGTTFTSRVVGEESVDGRPAVVTEVEGSAHLTGVHRFVLHADDPLGTGFLLR